MQANRKREARKRMGGIGGKQIFGLAVAYLGEQERNTVIQQRGRGRIRIDPAENERSTKHTQQGKSVCICVWVGRVYCSVNYLQHSQLTKKK